MYIINCAQWRAVPELSANMERSKAWPKGISPNPFEEVVIEGDMWIHMDVSPPALRSLTVLYKLTFANEREENYV